MFIFRALGKAIGMGGGGEGCGEVFGACRECMWCGDLYLDDHCQLFH